MAGTIEAGSFIIRAKFEENVIAGIDKLKDQLKGMGVNVESVKKSTENMNNTFTKTYGFWLNLMFMAQNLNKVFGGLRDLIFQVYLNSLFMELQLGMLNALQPILDPIIDTILWLVEAFYDLPEPLQLGISAIFLLMGVLVAVIPIVANIALLLSSLGGAGAGIATATGAISGAFGALSVVGGILLGVLGTLVEYIAGPLGVAIVLLAGAWYYNSSGIGTALNNLWVIFQSIFGQITDTIKIFVDFLDAIFKGDANRAFENLKKMAKNAIDIVVMTFTQLPGKLFSVFYQIEWGIGKFVVTIVSALWDLAGKAFSAMWSAGSNIVSGMVNGIQSIAWQVGNALWNMIPQPFRGWIQGAVGTGWNIASAIWNGINGLIGGGSSSSSSSSSSGTQASYNASTGMYSNGWMSSSSPFITMASGGIVDRPTLALIGESGPEAVVPLSGKNSSNIYGQNTFNFSPNVKISVTSVSSQSDINNLKRELNERWAQDFKRITQGW